MKRLLLLIMILAGCVFGASAQTKVSDFQTLIQSSDIKGKSEIITFVKTGDNVQEYHKFKSNLINTRFQRKHFKNYWASICRQVDSLNIVDFAKDTVLICQNFDGSQPFSPETMIVSGKGCFYVNHNGSIRQSEDTEDWEFHPILINAIVNLDLPRIGNIIAKYGSEPSEVTGPIWNTVYRIVVDDYKKIHSVAIDFDAMVFFAFRYETIR